MCSPWWGNLVAIDWNDLPVGREFDAKFLKNVKSSPHALLPPSTAVYKSGTGTRGRGHRDACVGTRDLGKRDEGLEEIKYGTRGRVGQGRGDFNTETQGTRDVTNYSKVGGKCDISFFVKICYLWSTLDSIFQNHMGHLMMFTQNTSS